MVSSLLLGNQRLYFFFYNYEDIGKLYKHSNNNSQNQYTVTSHYSEANAVYYTVNLMDGSLSSTSSPGYVDEIDRAITNLWDGSSNSADFSKPCAFATNRDIYTDSSFSSIWFKASENSIANTAPYITNYQYIPSWNFSTMNIAGYVLAGDTTNATYYYTLISNVNNGEYTSTLNIKPYIRSVDNGNHYQFNVPRQQLLTNFNISPGDVVNFTLRMKLSYRGGTITDDYNLGTYTLGITQEQADDINSNSNKQQLSDLNNAIDNQTTVIEQQTEVIQEQTQAIEDNTQATEHLEDTITDPTIESGASDLPSTDVNNPSQSGIDNIFQSIYNAFCTGQAQDIVFPIPFTNKNITLSPYYVRDMLNNNGASWVYLLIQAFWGYLIGRYIVKDISHKITKIKGGDIENIENNNIKGEML